MERKDNREHSNKRFVQNKDSKTGTVIISFPSEDTGLYPGDVIEFNVVSKGKIVVQKLESTDLIRNESTLNKILDVFGLHEHITYRLKDTNEQIDIKPV